MAQTSKHIPPRTARTLLGLLFLAAPAVLPAQTALKSEPLPFGHMDQWINRRITESAIIGSNTKSVYAVGPTETVSGAIPYTPKGGSPWATSNVMAKVVGIVKTNTSVFPERRNTGFCARLDTRLETIKVFGVVDMTVLAAGSLFLGKVHEPIRNTKEPNAKLSMGMPFGKRPYALQFDYKVKMSDRAKRMRATGFSKITDVEGKDYPTMLLLLQKRWEDKDGQVYAKRIGTIVEYYRASTDWQEKAVYPIEYGDLSRHKKYKPETMGLNAFDHYTVNSRGESVPIHEVGWGGPDDAPTHLILQFTSSHEGAYVGSPGNSFWIDNVSLLYKTQE